MNVAPKLGTTRSEAALVLVAALVSIYAISQFLRNSIGVIANDLARELDLTATQTGLLSSAFFFAFAAVQIPIGILIDRYGPKRTMLGTAVLTVLGTILFALASSASIAHCGAGADGARLLHLLHGAAGHLCPPVSA